VMPFPSPERTPPVTTTYLVVFTGNDDSRASPSRLGWRKGRVPLEKPPSERKPRLGNVLRLRKSGQRSMSTRHRLSKRLNAILLVPGALALVVAFSGSAVAP